MNETLYLNLAKEYLYKSPYIRKTKTDNDPNRLDESIFWQFINNLWEGHDVGIDFDSTINLNDKPDWLDIKKMNKGQKFAQDFYLSVFGSEVISLILSFPNENILRKLIWTGKSSDPYAAFKRYLSTANRVKSWMKDDLLDEKSNGYRNIKSVISMHKSFYKSLENVDENAFLNSTEISDAKSSICPFFLHDISNIDYPIDLKQLPKDVVPISQTEMIETQFAFIAFIILYPEKFGVCPIKYEKDLDAYVHLWRYLGYRLGTLDKYNLCSGTFQQVKIKCKIFLDFILKSSLKNVDEKWEHMSRSLVEGLQFYADAFSFEAHLMFALDMIGLEYTSLYNNSSVITKIELQGMKILNNYLIPVDWIRALITKLVQRQIDKVTSNMPTQEEFERKNKIKNG